MVVHGSGKYQVQVSVKHGAIQSHMVQIVVQYDAHQVTRSGTLWLAWPGPVLPGLVSVIAMLRVRGGGMATMLLCYLLAASSTTIIINVTVVVPL